MLFSKCLRAKIYCNMNVHFDPQGCQTLLLKESELFFFIFGLLDYIHILVLRLVKEFPVKSEKKHINKRKFVEVNMYA